MPQDQGPAQNPEEEEDLFSNFDDDFFNDDFFSGISESNHEGEHLI